MTQVSHASVLSGLGLIAHHFAGELGAGIVLTVTGILFLSVWGRKAV